MLHCARRHRVSMTSTPMLLACLIAVLPAADAMAQWPQRGGPGQDFVSKASGLAKTWPESGPRQLWTRDLGDGYSGVLVDGNGHQWSLASKIENLSQDEIAKRARALSEAPVEALPVDEAYEFAAAYAPESVAGDEMLAAENVAV